MAGFCSSVQSSYLGQFRGSYHNGPDTQPGHDILDPRNRPWMSRLLEELGND
jgi:hypothetical protein